MASVRHRQHIALARWRCPCNDDDSIVCVTTASTATNIQSFTLLPTRVNHDEDITHTLTHIFHQRWDPELLETRGRTRAHGCNLNLILCAGTSLWEILNSEIAYFRNHRTYCPARPVRTHTHTRCCDKRNTPHKHTPTPTLTQTRVSASLNSSRLRCRIPDKKLHLFLNSERTAE